MNHYWIFNYLVLFGCLMEDVHCLSGFQSVYINESEKKPLKEDWIRGPNNKEKLLRWLIGRNPPTLVQRNGVDGFFNNPVRPDLGAIDTQLLRRTSSQYADGVSRPSGSNRPNPLHVSERIMRGSSGTTSKTGKTALLVFFGQQLVEEILDAQKPACPPEYFNIPIPENHIYRNTTGLDELPFLRTRYDSNSGIGPNHPRQQLNEVTPYLDGNLVYGNSPTWTDLLRHFANGTLAPKGQLAWSQAHPEFPERNYVNLPMFNPPPPVFHPQFRQQHGTLPATRFFMLGNPRGNENPMLLSFGVLWFRWHNLIARYLAKIHNDSPEWNDERIFNEAKKWVIATYQHLVINHWIPEWIGEYLPAYKGYDSTVTPQIDQLFQSAAMRFGHTLVPSGVYLRDYGRYGCRPIANFTIAAQQWSTSSSHSAMVRTCNTFWRPQDILLSKIENGGSKMDQMDIEMGIERIIMGMASQLTEREDHMIVEDLRSSVFGPMEFPRRDLMALNIQRGRDHGVPDYNTARQSMGLPPVDSFESFIDQTSTCVHIHDEQVIRRLKELYGDINNIDVWPGGLLETSLGPGQLFKAVLKDQFIRIRKADRYWYSNFANGLFTKADVGRLEQLTLYDVIMAVTRMDADDLQENPFAAPSADLPGQKLSTMCMDQLTQEESCIQHKESMAYNNTCISSLPRYKCRFLPAPGSKGIHLEECTPPSTYSYFSGSEISLIVSILIQILVLAGIGFILIGLLRLKANRKRKQIEWDSIQKRDEYFEADVNAFHDVEWFVGYEWVNFKEGYRLVNLVFDSRQKMIQVRDENTEILRQIDLSKKPTHSIILTSNSYLVVLCLPKEYDLVIKCENNQDREKLLEHWERFASKCDLPYCPNVSCSASQDRTEKQVLSGVVTYDKRKKRLETFFRNAITQALHLPHEERIHLPSETLLTELTREEFARELRMTPDSQFVDKMFALVDKDKNGYISFQEFLNLLVIFSHGKADDKVELLFHMYDTHKVGKLTWQEFTAMIRSFIELSNTVIDEQQLMATVHSVLSSMNLQNSDEVTLADFKRLMNQHNDLVDGLQMQFIANEFSNEKKRTNDPSYLVQQTRRNLLDLQTSSPRKKKSRSREPGGKSGISREFSDDQVAIKVQLTSGIVGNISRLFRQLDNMRFEAFWIALFTLLVWGVFAERAYVYSIEKEHVGLRRATGVGIPITRGAASAMMLCFSVLLLAPCRHVTTWLRETAIVRYVPLDSAMAFHQYVAIWGGFFAVVHTVGHVFNFYHISTQPAQDLACLFREHYFPTHVLPKFQDWLWSTLTGVTGVLLVVVTAVIYVFAMPVVYRRLYVVFWWTHKLYPVFYMLLLLHGTGRLVQEPHFPYYLVGPAVLFGINRLISLNRRRVLVSVLSAQILPSDVTKLEIQRPPDFDYRSGQWIRLSCPCLGDAVFHAFSISSAPHSSNLTIHVRAVGRWTNRLRQYIKKALLLQQPLPKMYMDGPYGEGYQDWCRYKVAILIGGGIGVTPFSSILQDIVFQTNFGNAHHIACRKVYFLWVTRDQKQFEWMVDLLRDVEAKDKTRLISTHIFITQFYSKFDIRTFMLYVCERHFQKVAHRSLFTGLRALTHFGHPNFKTILQVLKSSHSNVHKIGVFSCGSRPLTRAVHAACRTVNEEGSVDFRHYSENY